MKYSYESKFRVITYIILTLIVVSFYYSFLRFRAHPFPPVHVFKIIFLGFSFYICVMIIRKKQIFNGMILIVAMVALIGDILWILQFYRKIPYGIDVGLYGPSVILSFFTRFIFRVFYYQFIWLSNAAINIGFWIYTIHVVIKLRERDTHDKIIDLHAIYKPGVVLSLVAVFIGLTLILSMFYYNKYHIRTKMPEEFTRLSDDEIARKVSAVLGRLKEGEHLPEEMKVIRWYTREYLKNNDDRGGGEKVDDSFDFNRIKSLIASFENDDIRKTDVFFIKILTDYYSGRLSNNFNPAVILRALFIACLVSCCFSVFYFMVHVVIRYYRIL